MILDGTDSNTAGIVLSYACKIAEDYSRQMLVEPLPEIAGPAVTLPGQVDLRSRAWFNENLESRNFFVPGVIVIVVGLVTLLLDQHGRGAREGDRHHGADHGHADHAGRVHPRQDACLSR